MDPGVNLHRAQLLRGGMVGATRPWIHPHLGLSPLERLNPAAEKYPQEVHPYQPLLPQLKGLTYELQLVEVLPSHPIPQEGRGIGKILVRWGAVQKHSSSGKTTSFTSPSSI
jgi:hypothetical protein